VLRPAIAPGEDRNRGVASVIGLGRTLRPAIAPGEDRNTTATPIYAPPARMAAPDHRAGRGSQPQPGQ